MLNWIVIPLRGLDSGKTRLAPVLSPAERRSLVIALLSTVAAAARGASGRSGRVVVISPDPAALAAAAALDADTLPEPVLQGDRPVMAADAGPETGLHRALEHALRHARAAGATAMTVIPADLPCVSSDDVAALIDAGRTRPAIAPDRAGLGTNGLAWPLAADPAFGFGPGSCERHRRLALARGATPVLLHRPGLAFDLDTPADWRRWRRTGAPDSPGLGRAA